MPAAKTVGAGTVIFVRQKIQSLLMVEKNRTTAENLTKLTLRKQLGRANNQRRTILVSELGKEPLRLELILSLHQKHVTEPLVLGNGCVLLQLTSLHWLERNSE